MRIELPKEPYRLGRTLEDGRAETYTFSFSEEGEGVRVVVDYEIWQVNGGLSPIARRRMFDKHYTPFDRDRLAEDWRAHGLGEFSHLFTHMRYIPLRHFDETIDGKRYVTQTAELLASDGPVWLWQATGEEDNLLRTPEGDYFLQHESTKGEDYIKPLSVSEAIEVYKRLRNKRVPFEEAFPGVKAEEA
ncbi:MAG: hypothetical protein IRY98_10745 [Alicyclobacillaceae bacterium]|nr:hypothetical protein [Alicyclobacillaceae bacterium]